MKTAIAGAGGFIGKALLERCLAEGEECTAIVRPGASAGKISAGYPAAQLLALNMDEYSCFGELLPGLDCLVVLAWAGTRGVARMDRELQQDNYRCVMAGIKSAVDAGCKKVVFAGSQAEYGMVNGVITEGTPPNPNTEYGKAKLQLYMEASKYCAGKGAAFVEPRFFSLYGPGDWKKSLVMDLAVKMREGLPCDLTECVQMWDFLYLDDAVDALYGLMRSPNAHGVYNFGSGDCRLLRDYVEEMKKVLKSSSPLNYGAIPYPVTGMVSIQPDISKLSSCLSWTAKTAFADGILRIVDKL